MENSSSSSTTDSGNGSESTLHEEAKSASESSDIRERVREITLKALSDRQLDKENISTVVRTVIEGVTEGLGESSEKLKPQLQESMAGIDDALSKSAIAAKLAAEEVAGRVEQFTERDLKKAVEDFKGLEGTFIESINSVSKNLSKSSGNLVSGVLSEIAEHLKNTGTESGKEAKNAVGSISESLLKAGKGTVGEISTAAQAVTGQFSNIASGILSGMADAISTEKTKS